MGKMGEIEPSLSGIDRLRTPVRINACRGKSMAIGKTREIHPPFAFGPRDWGELLQ